MKNNTSNLEVIYFDSSSLSVEKNLTYISKSISEYIHNSQSIIILCGAYANTHKNLLSLAQDSHLLSPQDIAQLLQEIIAIHKNTLDVIFEDNPDNNTHHLMQQQILEYSNELLTLLKGIHFLKEISTNTKNSLCSYSSKLSSVIIQAHIFSTYNTMFSIHNFDSSLAYKIQDKYQIIPIVSCSKDNLDTNIDTHIARYIIQLNAQKLNICTTQSGVMTANPKTIPTAQVISHIDYNTALEICYLGGKILHPDAILILKKAHLPISISSFSPDTNSISIISNKTAVSHNTKKSYCITITERDKISILTIKSTKMFHAYGYLEQIFKIFNEHKISIETLSTSEISVTLTFPTKYYSESLIKNLSQLGKLEYLSEQSIISLVGSWKEPTYIAKCLEALKDIPLNMISLGQTSSNLNLVINTKQKYSAVTKIHSCLF